jgi:hypothetical protein
MEVEVKKANKNQQDIFPLQLLQGNSSIFAVIELALIGAIAKLKSSRTS